MKFRWVPNSFGRSGIVATREMSDSQPLYPELWIDYNIEHFDQDRFAVASSLAFGAFADRRLFFDAAVSQSTSSAIQSFLGRGSVNVHPVLFSDKSSLSGDTLMILSDDNTPLPHANGLGRHRLFGLNVLSSDRYSGGILQMDQLTISSNAWLHSGPGLGIKRGCYPYLAAAVLLAADFGIGAIEIKVDDSELKDQLHGVRAMFRSVGLNLVECSSFGTSP